MIDGSANNFKKLYKNIKFLRNDIYRTHTHFLLSFEKWYFYTISLLDRKEKL